MTQTRLFAVVLAAVVGAGLTGCSSDPSAAAVGQTTPPPAGQIAPIRVNVDEFAAFVARPGVQIIDVRTPEEFAEGHIERAKNIPVQQADFADRLAQLDPNGVYAVYCRSGNRSKPAVAQMNAAGITAIYELSEGTNGWTAAGQPLTR